MKHIVFLNLFLILSISATSQNLQTNKIIVDRLTKKGLENVSIYNNQDNSISNQDGLFSFVSNKSEINFDLMGYTSIKTTFEKLKSKDTVFMESKPIELNEVIVSDLASIIKKAYENLKINYMFKPYSENFFLRGILKNNNEIVRLQDIYGKISQKAMFQTPEIKNEYLLEILNMRKVGVFEIDDLAYLEFLKFEDMLNLSSSIQLKSRDFYDFTTEKSIDPNYRKISFITKDKDEKGQKISGYFIINKVDYAIIEFSLDFYDDVNVIPFEETRGHKHRTTSYRLVTNFKKNESENKYYASNIKIDVSLQILADEKTKATNYDYSTNFFVTNSFTNDKVNSNFSSGKDIFKAKFPYSDIFWSNQNQLPLTNELKGFLKRVSENKDKKKEYDIIGNF